MITSCLPRNRRTIELATANDAWLPVTLNVRQANDRQVRKTRKAPPLSKGFAE